MTARGVSEPVFVCGIRSALGLLREVGFARVAGDAMPAASAAVGLEGGEGAHRFSSVQRRSSSSQGVFSPAGVTIHVTTCALFPGFFLEPYAPIPTSGLC